MNLKEIRQELGWTQKEMVKEIKKVCKPFDVSLLSKIENGVCEPSVEVKAYCEKQLASHLDKSSNNKRPIYQQRIKNLLNDPFYYKLYNSIKQGSRVEPMTRERLCEIMNSDDRSIRKAISDMRSEGLTIMSTSSHYGYWIANKTERIQLVREYRHRAYELLKVALAMEYYHD